MKSECAEIRALDANYPGRYHRLGTYIIEVRTRLGDDDLRQALREERIDDARAWRAEQIARLYTLEQAVAFPSLRAILKTIPPKQPRAKANLRGTAGPQADPLHVPPEPSTEETLLDRFIQLGIKVRERLGDGALDRAVEQIKAHAAETFEDAFLEVQ